MKKTDKLTEKQVLSIPKMLKTMSVGELATEWGVSWQAIWYWVDRLRKKGIKINTRPKGQTSFL